MKIAVNARFLLPGRLEGIGWFTLEVIRRLAERHPDREFLLLFDRPVDVAEFGFGSNVRGRIVWPPARHPLLWYAWFERAVPRVLKDERPDLFFSPDGYCSLRSRLPTVMVTHDIAHAHFPEQLPALSRRYYDYFVPRYLRRADRLITVSEFSRTDIGRHFGIPADRIAVCGNGARPGFRPLGAAEREAVKQEYAGGQEYFFYVGSVNPRKNVARLIRAFDRFRQRTGAPVRLLVGGRFGWMAGEVKAAYGEALHRADIRFLDYVPEAGLPRLLGAALALTYVSLFEGFGLPLLEAMEAETPIVTSDTSSMPEVAGEAALFVNPYDVDAIAAALERMWREEGLRRRLVELGRTRRTRFSWDAVAEVVERELKLF